MHPFTPSTSPAFGCTHVLCCFLLCSERRYYNANPAELLLAAAGGRFSEDIDGHTTLVVTGTTSAKVAMDAAEGKHDRYTLAMRQKLDADRPG